MASKNFSDWETPVGRYIKGALSADIANAVLHTVRDFCEWTNCWTYDLAAITTVANTAEYAFVNIDTDGKNLVSSIQAAQYKEDGAANSQFFDLAVGEYDVWEARKSASWKYETSPNPNTILYNHVDAKFRLYPIPSVGSTSGLIVRINAKPTMAATKCPVFIYNQYEEAITRGAAAWLMNETNKPWSNKEMAKIYRAEYIDLRHNAAFEKKQGKTNRKIHVRPRIPFLPGSKVKFRAVAGS